MKYQFVLKQRTHYPVIRLCGVLDISRSAYYHWVGKSESHRSIRQTELVGKIKRIHVCNRQVYGSPRIHAELIEQGENVCVNTVAKLMKLHCIQSKVFKKFVVTTESRHFLPASPNRLNRHFSADNPNKKWVSDVTFIATREGWLYLATIMDLFSRRIIGWSMSHRNDAALVVSALEMSVAQRSQFKNVILHSDRGILYASKRYREKLAQYKIISSMSRKGDCWDNAPMESFYHSLKTECVNFENYRTRNQARQSLFEYIELFYNRKRKHSTIGYVSPNTFEARMNVH